ncbi:MAG: hypothetical protein Q8R82_15905 [Hyphomonadaceae bacterium]|nr:hypothetical protein [Hyphomonadaceae bacterium]
MAIIAAGISGVALLGGCADIMQQQAISQISPDWFEQKAIEVKGEGYPELSEIPQTRAISSTRVQSDRQAAALKNQAAQMEAALNAQGAISSDEDVRARAAQWRACVEERKADCGTPDKPAPAAATTPVKPGR